MKKVKRNIILLMLLLVLITGCSKENGGEAIQTTAEPSATDAASQPAEESPSFAPEEAWKNLLKKACGRITALGRIIMKISATAFIRYMWRSEEKWFPLSP